MPDGGGLGLSLLFSAGHRSTVTSVRSPAAADRTIEATPATAIFAKPIEQLQAGERVLSRDEHTGELVFRPVAQTFVRTSDHLRLLTIRTSAGVDEQIETTDEHPFWVEGTGWTAAKSLQAGQRLTEPDGSISTVVASARVEQPDGVTVYNFEVEDTHSYFVAARGSRGPPVWVHNADGYDDAIAGGAATKNGPGDGIYDGIIFPGGKFSTKSLDRPYPYSAFEMDQRLMVKMRPARAGESQNAAGFLRDAETYWKTMLRQYPEAFSADNVKIINGLVKNSNGKVVRMPKNDATFRSVFTKYDLTGLRGQPMVHHHIGGGAWAAGIPQPLHKGTGGIHVLEDLLGITIR
jgi:hypothetical protein